MTEALTLFIQFVKLNPHLKADDPVMPRVFRAYMDLAPDLEDIWL